MNGSLISIVIPTYNRYREAIRAIRSVENQTYRPIEIIVIEDGSDSGIEQWIKQKNLDKKDMEIIYFNNKNNLGLSATKNRGVSLSSGEYVAILDDDDEWKSEKLERQMGLICTSNGKNEPIGVVSTGFEIRYKDSRYVNFAPGGNRGNLRENIIKKGIITPSSTFLFPRKVLLSVRYDETLRSSTDHDIMMSLAKEGYSGIATDEALAITYSRLGRSSNMTNTYQRIDSIHQFLEKWSSVYQEWMGEIGADKYCKRYFAQVVSWLIVNKLYSKKYKEAFYCVRSIFKFSGVSIDTLRIILVPVIKRVIKNIIPEPIFVYVKKTVRK